MAQSVFTQPWEQTSWQPKYQFVYGDDGQIFDVTGWNAAHPGQSASTLDLGNPDSTTPQPVYEQRTGPTGYVYNALTDATTPAQITPFDQSNTDPQYVGDYRRFLEESTG